MKTSWEWARASIQSMVLCKQPDGFVPRELMENMVAAVIREAVEAAVEEEREACAKIAEAAMIESGEHELCGEEGNALARGIADAIRQRGEA